MRPYSYELQKKVNQSIKLLQSFKGQNIELCYSGGKDSDVMLRLAEMANIEFTPIHKVTTLDPSGTIKHCLRIEGIELRRPQKTMLQLIREHGMPTRRVRFCCRYLKEYKILDISMVGIRASESVKRAKRYKEPVVCRYYSKSEKVQQILPILGWSDSDIQEFIEAENIKLAPHYYGEDGNVVYSRRLGCQGCPMKADNGLSDFVKNPKLGRLWLKALRVWWNNHPLASSRKRFRNVEELFVHNLFYSSYENFRVARDAFIEPLDCVSVCKSYGWL